MLVRWDWDWELIWYHHQQQAQLKELGVAAKPITVPRRWAAGFPQNHRFIVNNIMNNHVVSRGYIAVYSLFSKKTNNYLI